MSEAGASFRRRLDDDLPALTELLRRVHDEDGYPGRLPADLLGWLTGHNTIEAFVATLPGGRLAGHVGIATAKGDQAGAVWAEATGLKPERLGVIKRLFVDPELKKRGIGRALLALSVARCHERGLRPVLDVSPGNLRPQRLYERAGFELVGKAELERSDGKGAFSVLCYVGPERVGES